MKDKNKPLAEEEVDMSWIYDNPNFTLGGAHRIWVEGKEPFNYDPKLSVTEQAVKAMRERRNFNGSPDSEDGE